jgi:hypothetical protein
MGRCPCGRSLREPGLVTESHDCAAWRSRQPSLVRSSALTEIVCARSSPVVPRSSARDDEHQTVSPPFSSACPRRSVQFGGGAASHRPRSGGRLAGQDSAGLVDLRPVRSGCAEWVNLPTRMYATKPQITGRYGERSARMPLAVTRPSATASAQVSRPVARRTKVIGSVSTTLGGVPRVWVGPSTH